MSDVRFQSNTCKAHTYPSVASNGEWLSGENRAWRRRGSEEGEVPASVEEESRKSKPWGSFLGSILKNRNALFS
jgi:hypothetical protein